MRVFLLQRDYEFAGLKSENSRSAFQWSRRFDGTTAATEWVLQRVYVERTADNTDPGDFPVWVGSVPAFSQNAVDKLASLLHQSGELLPLSSMDGTFYAYNVTALLDALDEQQSSVARYATGDGVMNIDRHVFKACKIGGHAIFKITQFLYSDVFVTDVFVDRVHSCDLRGFRFAELWKNP